MKALIQKELGAYPEYGDVKIDKEGTQVELTHSALNHRDLWISRGRYPGLVFPKILGSDGAGIIDGREVVINPSIEWGSSQSHQGENFRVLGMPDDGTFAEFINIDQSYIFDKPDHLELYEAAALPLAGLTAYRSLIHKCQPKLGEKVLINGIGGGVASMAFQFAKALGNEVYVTSGSDEKIRFAMDHGAAGGVNYKKDHWEKEVHRISDGIDIIIDSAGGPNFSKLLKVCNPAGKIAIYGGTNGSIEKLSPQILFWKQISIYGSTMGSNEDFSDMLDFVSLHNIKPIVHDIISMSNSNLAFDILKEGKQIGKIVLDNKS